MTFPFDMAGGEEVAVGKDLMPKAARQPVTSITALTATSSGPDGAGRTAETGVPGTQDEKCWTPAPLEHAFQMKNIVFIFFSRPAHPVTKNHKP